MEQLDQTDNTDSATNTDESTYMEQTHKILVDNDTIDKETQYGANHNMMTGELLSAIQKYTTMQAEPEITTSDNTLRNMDKTNDNNDIIDGTTPTQLTKQPTGESTNDNNDGDIMTHQTCNINDMDTNETSNKDQHNTEQNNNDENSGQRSGSLEDDRIQSRHWRGGQRPPTDNNKNGTV